jgi:hypothetical protein
MSYWIFLKSYVEQIQWFVWNFLWVGNRGEATRPKVAWETITLPKSSGGLGIIDPVYQSKAMLTKLVVKSVLPRGDMEEVITKLNDVLRRKLVILGKVI